MPQELKEIIGIFSGIIALAIIATLVSNSANTANVITALFGGLSSAVGAAESPVSGGSSVNSALSGLTNSFGGSGGP